MSWGAAVGILLLLRVSWISQRGPVTLLAGDSPLVALGLECPWLSVLCAQSSCWKPREMLVPGSAPEMLLKDPFLLLEFAGNVGLPKPLHTSTGHR